MDPITTFIFSIAVISTTIPTTKQCVQILMQTVPVHVDQDDLVEKITKIAGVEEIHDLHVWGIGSSQVLCTAHVAIRLDQTEHDCLSKILPELNDAADKCGIHHATFQLERFGEGSCRVQCGQVWRSTSREPVDNV